ncbi:hypothetical protein WJX81_004263 [Elliptochloris bilobata]|uniref:Uncharacterized protein n=1 Tax=Elliptochloris bilobata TaxID=381761 RepID=A0AAW1RYN4_9CHLO
MSGPGSVSNQVGSGYLEDWQIIGVVGHQDLRAEKRHGRAKRTQQLATPSRPCHHRASGAGGPDRAPSDAASRRGALNPFRLGGLTPPARHLRVHNLPELAHVPAAHAEAAQRRLAVAEPLLLHDFRLAF